MSNRKLTLARLKAAEKRGQTGFCNIDKANRILAEMRSDRVFRLPEKQREATIARMEYEIDRIMGNPVSRLY